MASKKLWLGLLVIALAFGMAVVGCDNGSTGGGTDTALNGTWVGNDGELKLDNGSYELSGMAKGTYTTSGKNVTITTTHVHGSMFEGMLESKWYSKAELKSVLQSSGYMTNAEIDNTFASMKGTYSIDDDILIMTMEGETRIFTKKSNKSIGEETDDTYYYNKAKKELYLRLNEYWESNIDDPFLNWHTEVKIKDIFSGTLKANTDYLLTVRGTIDQSATWFGVFINNNKTEWIQVATLDFYDCGQISGNFTKIFHISTGDHNFASIRDTAFANFWNSPSNYVPPEGISVGEIIATISNFSATITEVMK